MKGLILAKFLGDTKITNDFTDFNRVKFDKFWH